MRFDETQNKFIAEYYVDNFDVMSGRKKATPDGNRQKPDLLRELTERFNEIFSSDLTIQQIHDKVKNMRKAAKTKLKATMPETPVPTGRDDSMPAIEIIMEKLKNITGSCSADDDDDDHDAPSEHSYVNNSVVQQDSVGQHLATAMRYRLTDDARTNHSSPVAKRPRVSTTPITTDGVGALQKSVLLLQKQVAEKELKVLNAKEATLTKASLALDEFRRYVAEQRILCRGISLGNTPVDIPPGLEGILDQLN